MAPLSPDTRTDLQNAFQSSVDETTATEDIMEIACFIKVCNGDGLSLGFTEAEPFQFSSDFRGKVGRGRFRQFFHFRRVLLALTDALEGEDRCRAIDSNLLKLQKGKEFTDVFRKFLVENYNEHSLVLSVFKCISQTLVSIALKEFKGNQSPGLVTEPIANSWRVTVMILPDKVYIIHTKKEKCSISRFEIKWEFMTSIFLANPNLLDDIHFNICDIRFELDFITPNLQNEVLQQLKSYLKPELWEFSQEKTIPIMTPLSIAGGISALMNGEHILGIFEDVRYLHSNLPSELTTSGRLVITNYKLVFASNEDFEVVSVPLTTIAKVTKKDRKEVEITCKEILIFRLVFSSPNFTPFQKLLGRIFPLHSSQLFAFEYAEASALALVEEKYATESAATNGWRVYNPSFEFKRLQLDSSPWRLSKINATFQVCPSYPKRLILPQQFDDGEAVMAAQVRSNGRVPIVSWRHRNGSILSHGAALKTSTKVSESIPARTADKNLINGIIKNATVVDTSVGALNSAEPELGHTRSSSVDDKGRLKTTKKRSKSRVRIQLGHQSSQSSTPVAVPPNSSDFCIIDIIAESDAGKIIPTEIEENNITVVRETLVMESLLDMKESYRKLQKLCLMPYNISLEEHWLTYLDGTNWLDHIRNLMRAAHQVAATMATGSSVLLSYSEVEFDRACQISSLAQLWMDPYYRTLTGFIVLIEKEWLGFGHPFRARCGNLSTEDGNEVIPVFIQFLDCIWQTMQQFPQHFEFNNKLLIELSVHTYSSLYGTFLFNSEQDRRIACARSTTDSFWTHIIADKSYKNPLFVGKTEGTIIPSYDARAVSLWTSYFLRWYPGVELVSLPRVSTGNCGQDILAMVNDMNQIDETTEFTNKLNILKQAEQDIKEKIRIETEKLEFLKAGMSMESAREKILLKMQVAHSTPVLRCNTDGGDKRRRRSKRLRNSTASIEGLPVEVENLLHVPTEPRDAPLSARLSSEPSPGEKEHNIRVHKRKKSRSGKRKSIREVNSEISFKEAAKEKEKE